MIRITNFKRVLCILCALLLVFSMTTRPVMAVEWALVAKWVAGSLLAGAVLSGLGVLVEDALESGNQKLQEAIASIKFAWKDRTVSDKVEVYTDSEGKVYIPEEMIEEARDALYESGLIVVEEGRPPVLPAGQGIKYDINRQVRVGVDTTVFSLSPYGNGATYLYLASLEPFQNYSVVWYGSSPVYTYDSLNYTYNGMTFYYACVKGSSTFISGVDEILLDYEAHLPYIGMVLSGEISGGLDKITVAEGFKAGYIAGRDQGLAEGYAQWADGAIENQTEDERELYYPIGLGATLEDVQGMTQEQIWEGGVTQAELSDTLQMSLSQHLANIKGFLRGQFQDLIQGLENIKLTMQQSLQGLQQLGQMFTTTTLVQSPLEALHFGAMFDLFPFSIPYDLVQCINFWGASAAAPTLTIPLPTVQGGRAAVTTYDVNLGELPGFNQIAALIRAGELILFGIGLVLITRKVTKW